MIKRLGDIASFRRGLTYSKGDEAPLSNKRVLRSNNIDLESNSLDLSEIKYLREDFIIPDDRKLVANSIFICMSNGSKQHVGKVAFIPEDMDYAFGGFMGLIVPSSEVSAKYVFYACQSSAYRSFLSQVGNGIGITNLRFTDLEKFEFPVPSLADQQRIVAELDLLSGIIENKNAQLKTLDDLAQSIFYEMFGDVEEKTPLSTYVTELSGGKSLAGDEENQYKVLKTGAVTFDYFRGDDVKNLPLDYIPREEDRVKKGDLLISRMNTAELVGAVAYVWDVKPNIYLPDRLWRASLTEAANPIFIWKALIQFDAKQQIRSLASGTSGTMKNISKPKLLSITIPKTSREKQDSFAQRLRAIQRQRNCIEESKKVAAVLFASRMDQYFNA